MVSQRNSFPCFLQAQEPQLLGHVVIRAHELAS